MPKVVRQDKQERVNCIAACVEYTPGIFMYKFSEHQKQPIPNIATLTLGAGSGQRMHESRSH